MRFRTCVCYDVSLTNCSCYQLFGVVTFADHMYIPIPPQMVSDEFHKAQLRQHLCDIRCTDGGTRMYAALQYAVSSMLVSEDQESWIVCLTDGETSGSDHRLRETLSRSRSNLHLVVIGVNLCSSYEDQMILLCSKYNTDEKTKGFFVAASATLATLNQAFETVASRIPVSRTFELDGRLSDEDCRVFLRKYSPQSLPEGDMLLQQFWVRFLYRRVKVFDENASFNYNEKYEELGSSLMQTMLEEVNRLLDSHHCRDWSTSHTQLIYDFQSGSPEFRLVCTAPETLDGDVREKLERLDLPGFCIPTSEQLQQRTTLDRFLSQAIGVPLEKVDEIECLRCIGENGFILTLDFTMKLLNIHERVACRVPCIIEGETGVSKTALTKMYAILRNSSLRAQAEASTQQDLLDICKTLREQGSLIDSSDTPIDNLHRILREASELTIGNETDMARKMHELVMEKCKSRSSLFSLAPKEFDLTDDARTKSVAAFLSWFGKTELESTYFEVNVDASLTETDVAASFEEIRCIARKIQDSEEALIVVFLDGKYLGALFAKVSASIDD